MEIFGCKNLHAADFFRTLCWWSFQQILKITLIMDHLFVSMDSRLTHCWSLVHLSLFIDLIFVDLIFSVFSIQRNLKKTLSIYRQISIFWAIFCFAYEVYSPVTTRTSFKKTVFTLPLAAPILSSVWYCKTVIIIHLPGNQCHK